jgi:hypothetical protein
MPEVQQPATFGAFRPSCATPPGNYNAPLTPPAEETREGSRLSSEPRIASSGTGDPLAPC